MSAGMLADVGASHVVVGHAERRADHGETDADVRDAGWELDVIGAQLAGSVRDGATGEDTVVAYEPVWAIGSGRTPTASTRLRH